MTLNSSHKNPASFRDPSGFVFKRGGSSLRQVNSQYKENYDLLLHSGLFEELVNKKYLIDHREIDKPKKDKIVYKILKPDQIPFISYPYEWSFSALKDAALLTLEIEATALQFGMSLKDASAYNIQFSNGRPILIDTLSFEKYPERQPWVAYRQFCQHFLAPLALMSQVDPSLSSLLKIYIDGIPLDLAAKLLPAKNRFSVGLLSHIFLHAKSQKNHSDTNMKKAPPQLNKNQLLAIIDNLKSTVRGLKLQNIRTTWDDYYNNTNYSAAGFKQKERLVKEWIGEVGPKKIWDAGANNGHFSRFGSEQKIFTISTDFDLLATESNYLEMKKSGNQYLLPLLLDLTNPTPAIGWDNAERDSFFNRGTFDLTLCLALIHHLAITNNLPLSNIADIFSRQSKNIIIEFVPKTDSNTQRLLANREDIFDKYDNKSFETEFSRFFKIVKSVKIKDSHRTLYLMRKK